MKWTTLRHNGVAFPPSEKYRGLAVSIRGEQIKLDPLQEEMLLAWAKKKDTPYVQDPVFQQNFLRDLVQVLPERFAHISLGDIDFSALNAIVDREKTANLSAEEKKQRSAERKAVRQALKAQFGTAWVDDTEAEVGAYLVEPPGILMGRGAHPLRGKWKRRIQVQDVTLNLDEDAPVPEGNWKRIVHEHDALWIASWYDELSAKLKYIWLADSSPLRQEQDREKYLKAVKLESGLAQVREHVHQGMESGNVKIRKVATVCYLIDKLAMRVGDEKDEDEADTVGASTLRVEHVKIGDEAVKFDFLGKDSIRWEKSIAIVESTDLPGFRKPGRSVPNPDSPIIGDADLLARNLSEFVAGKQPEALLFDGIDSTRVNRFLGKALPGLTAKVFRTYYATTIVRNSLEKNSQFDQDTPGYEKEYVAKLANLEAAITCNHKRTPPKTWEHSLVRREEALQNLEATEAKNDKAGLRRQERLHKARRQLELAKATRDYNLGTSLKNYIDPRVYKDWGERVGFEWKRLYTKALQRKFEWVNLAPGADEAESDEETE